MSESEIQREILNSISQGSLRCWRQQAGRVFVVPYRPGLRGHWMDLAPAGAADLCGIDGTGRILQIEVKSATGKQRPEQVAWERMIRSRGGIYILARSVEEARARLAEVGCTL